MPKTKKQFRKTIKIYYYSLFVFFLLGCYNGNLYGQVPVQGNGDMSIPKGLPDVLPPSPTVAALMKFEEVQVNGYNGVPDISIPIGNLKGKGGIDLNVKLGYHPSNINANNASPDTGLGWSLFAGGSISRTVKGLPDEIFKNVSKLGIYRTSSSANANINAYYDIFYSNNQNVTNQYMWDVLVNGKSDTEHDLWQYNFLGYSGRFIIMKKTNGILEVVKLDRNPLKIINYYDATTFVPTSFDIIDDNGTKYKFDIVETTKTHTTTTTEKGYGQPGTSINSTLPINYKSSFHLSEVYNSSNVLAIKLSYTNDSKKEKMKFRSRTMAVNNGLSDSYHFYDGNGALPEFNPLPFMMDNSTTMETTVRKLSRINVIGQGRIDFTYTTGRLDDDDHLEDVASTYKLSQIKILTWEDSVQQKRFDFAYHYSTKINTRMMLSSVKVYNKLNIFEYDYRLTYRSFDDNLGVLGQDVWGYINQRPNYMPSVLYRETSPAFCTNDALELMKLPTGGAIKYNFESNTYSYIGNENLTNFDNNPDNWKYETTDPPIIFTTRNNNTTAFFSIYSTQDVYFQAVNNFMLSGINDWHYSIYRVENGVNVYVGGLFNLTERVMNLTPGDYAVSFYTPQLPSGSPFVFSARIYAHYKRKLLGTIYNPVVEKKYLYGGGIRIKNIEYYTDFNNGNPSVLEKQTNYNYAFFDTISRSSGSLVYPKPIFKYQKNKRECMRTYSDSLRTIELNRYDVLIGYDITTTTDNLAAVKTQGSEVGYKNVTITETGNGRKELTYTSAIDFPEVITNYNLMYPFLPTENIDYKRGNLVISKTFDNQNRLLDETINTYNYSDYETLQTGLRFYFPQDNQFINYFNYHDYGSYESYLATCTSCFCSSGLASSFISFMPIKETNGIAQLETTMSKNYFYPNNGMVATSVTRTANYTYDPYNKKISTQQVTNANGDVLLTDYKYARNFVPEQVASAMVSKNMLSMPLRIINYKNGAKLDEQKILYKEWATNLIAPEIVKAAKGTQSLENKTLFNKYDTYGNLLEAQQENGTRVCYIWGYDFTQPVAKIENISYSSIPPLLISNIISASDAEPYSESDLQTALTALRNHASVGNAMVTTYTYIPSVGVSTVIDPKGYKTTYSYDDFGRLSSVKDADGKLLSTNSYNYRP